MLHQKIPLAQCLHQLVAGPETAFLHLNARLPKDGGVRRAIYACLCRQNVFRLTRRNITGMDDTSPAPNAALRQRRGQLALKLLVRSATEPTEQRDSLGSMPQPGSPASGEDNSDESSSDADEAAPQARRQDGSGVDSGLGGLLVVPSTSAGDDEGISLPCVIDECMEWHQLYPDAGCTPAVVFLRALDPEAAMRVATAFKKGALPHQQEQQDDCLLNYSLEVCVPTANLPFRFRRRHFYHGDTPAPSDRR